MLRYIYVLLTYNFHVIVQNSTNTLIPFFAFYFFFFLPRDIGFIGYFPAGGVPLLLTLARLGGGGAGRGAGTLFFFP